MGIKSTIRGGNGNGRGDNPHYPWHPSMGIPHPSESGGGGGKKPPKTGVATGDDGEYSREPNDENKERKDRAVEQNVYLMDEYRKRKHSEEDY